MIPSEPQIGRILPQTAAALQSKMTRRGVLSFLTKGAVVAAVTTVTPAEAGWLSFGKKGRDKSTDGRPEDHPANIGEHDKCIRGNCAENIPDKEKGPPLSRTEGGTECEGEFVVENNAIEINNGSCTYPGGDVEHFVDGRPIDSKLTVTTNWKSTLRPVAPRAPIGQSTSEGVFTHYEGKYHKGHCSNKSSSVPVVCNKELGGFACSTSKSGRNWDTDEYQAARKACR